MGRSIDREAAAQHFAVSTRVSVSGLKAKATVGRDSGDKI
jgi:hypothetical protein